MGERRYACEGEEGDIRALARLFWVSSGCHMRLYKALSQEQGPFGMRTPQPRKRASQRVPRATAAARTPPPAPRPSPPAAPPTCQHTHIYTHIYTHTHTHTHTLTHTHVYIHIYVHTYIGTCTSCGSLQSARLSLTVAGLVRRSLLHVCLRLQPRQNTRAARTREQERDTNTDTQAETYKIKHTDCEERGARESVVCVCERERDRQRDRAGGRERGREEGREEGGEEGREGGRV